MRISSIKRGLLFALSGAVRGRGSTVAMAPRQSRINLQDLVNNFSRAYRSVGRQQEIEILQLTGARQKYPIALFALLLFALSLSFYICSPRAFSVVPVKRFAIRSSRLHPILVSDVRQTTIGARFASNFSQHSKIVHIFFPPAINKFSQVRQFKLFSFSVHQNATTKIYFFFEFFFFVRTMHLSFFYPLARHIQFPPCAFKYRPIQIATPPDKLIHAIQ